VAALFCEPDFSFSTFHEAFMTARTAIHNLQVANPLLNFINDTLLPATGVKKDKFWQGFNDIVNDLAPKNVALLAERDRIQTAMDQWHAAHPGPVAEGQAMKAYRKYLSQIGYLVPEPKKVKATTAHVDAELAKLAGPQLVVPILNARYALNAANARWGSLYDALYGTCLLYTSDAADE
jgi:malate synthase